MGVIQDSVADLAEQSIDLAIRIASDPDPSLIGKPIAVSDSVLVASPEYLATKNDILHPQDLTGHDCLGYKDFERHVWHLSQNESSESVDVECRLTANEATTLCHAALQGMGVALQLAYLASAYMKSGQLQSVLSDWKPHDLKIYVLYSSRKHLSPGVRALIDYLEQYLLDNPW